MLSRLFEGFSWTILSLLLLGSAPLWADDSLMAAQRLTAILEQTETLTADVEQLTLDQQGREVQASYASLKMHQPDRFYWHATRPWEELLVTDGESLWIYEPDLEQVTIETFNEATSHTPAMLLSADAASLARDFDVSIIENTNGFIRFRLLPRQPEALFEELYLSFQSGQLNGMQFSDSLGQRTSLSFRNVKVNVSLDAATFSFDIPEDVDVIDARRP